MLIRNASLMKSLHWNKQRLKNDRFKNDWYYHHKNTSIEKPCVFTIDILAIVSSMCSLLSEFVGDFEDDVLKLSDLAGGATSKPWTRERTFVRLSRGCPLDWDAIIFRLLKAANGSNEEAEISCIELYSSWTLVDSSGIRSLYIFGIAYWMMSFLTYSRGT